MTLMIDPVLPLLLGEKTIYVAETQRKIKTLL